MAVFRVRFVTDAAALGCGNGGGVAAMAVAMATAMATAMSAAMATAMATAMSAAMSAARRRGARCAFLLPTQGSRYPRRAPLCAAHKQPSAEQRINVRRLSAAVSLDLTRYRNSVGLIFLN